MNNFISLFLIFNVLLFSLYGDDSDAYKDAWKVEDQIQQAKRDAWKQEQNRQEYQRQRARDDEARRDYYRR